MLFNQCQILSQTEDQTLWTVSIQKISESAMYAKAMCHWLSDAFSTISYGGLIVAQSMLHRLLVTNKYEALH